MNHKTKRVAVVGAAGGVGRHTVRALLSEGYEVVAIDRREPSAMSELKDIVDHSNVQWHRVQIEKDPLSPLFENVFAVVNAAGDVGLAETYSEMVASNVVGVDRLYSGAKEANVEHIVHLSTGTFYAQGPGLRVETDEIECITDFAQSKYDSEMIFRRSATNGTHWTILRPSYIYGPGCRSMAAGLVTLPPILGDFLKYQLGFRSGARITWCHVEDLASAILTVLGNKKAYGEIYNVADNTPQSAGECITSITEAYGLQIGVVVPIPTKLLLSTTQRLLESKAFAQGAKGVLRQLWRRIVRRHMLQTPLKPRLNAQAASHLAKDLVLDNRRLVSLGWNPKWVSFASGIGATIAWYQKEGWVPSYDPGHMERVRLDSKPSLFSFEQTLTGHLEVSDSYQPKMPLQKTLRSKKEVMQRLELSDKNGASRRIEDHVVIQFEVTLKSLLHGEGDIEGLIWIYGITSRAVPLIGTYTFNLRENRFWIDFGFTDPEGRNYRATLSGKRGGLLSAISKQTFPQTFKGILYDRHGEPVGHLTLNLLLAETVLSILFGLR